ncbi:hypothetical protein KR044_008896, partial [Drosophila immigrans]
IFPFVLLLLLTLLGLGHAQPASFIKWGELVEHIPTAVSHQSSTVVHSSVPQRTSLLTPAVRSFVVSSLRPAAAYVHAAHLPAALGWRYLYAAPASTTTTT